MNKHFNPYLNINTRTLDLTERLIKRGYFKKRFNERFKMLIYFNKKLSKIYQIKTLPIKIIPYTRFKYKYNKDFIEIGDSLSLVSFLSKFKLHLENSKSDTDNKEVKLKRDCLDWALSVIKFSDEILMSKILTSIENNILNEDVTTKEC